MIMARFTPVTYSVSSSEVMLLRNFFVVVVANLARAISIQIWGITRREAAQCAMRNALVDDYTD